MTIDALGALAPALSPSLTAGNGAAAAFELKFLLRHEDARPALAWARQRLTPDPHGEDGRYRTTTLYCDTPRLDVFYRSPGYRRSKYRLRRYGTSTLIHLERKTKRGDRVRKRRNVLELERLDLLASADPEPDWPWAWFLRQLRFRGLGPACRIAYDRTAFIGTAPEGSVRLTLDQNVIGVPACAWDLPPLDEGRPLLTDAVLLEMKFHAVLPALFRELMDLLPPNLGGVSKYRLCVQAWGLPGEAGPCPGRC